MEQPPPVDPLRKELLYLLCHPYPNIKFLLLSISIALFLAYLRVFFITGTSVFKDFIAIVDFCATIDIDNGVLFLYEAVNNLADFLVVMIFTVTSSVAYQFFYVGLVISAVIFSCGTDENREKVHVTKRQELKNLQHDAMLAGRPVQSVIEEAQPVMFQSNSRLSSERRLPDLEAPEKHRVLTKSVNKTSLAMLEALAFLESTQGKHAIDIKQLSPLVGIMTESTTITTRHPGTSQSSTSRLTIQNKFISSLVEA